MKNQNYIATESGIAIEGQEGLAWGDLSDALATIMSPFSSASALRAELVSALAAGEVLGRADILEQVLRDTAPCLVEPLDATNEEIAAVTGKSEYQ